MFDVVFYLRMFIAFLSNVVAAAQLQDVCGEQRSHVNQMVQHQSCTVLQAACSPLSKQIAIH